MTEPPGKLVPIVEGDGELDAVRWLLRQVLHERGEFGLDVTRPVNAHGKGNLTVAGGLEKHLEYAALRPGCRGILVLVDANGDCPIETAQGLAERAAGRRMSVPTAVVAARRAYESWLVASIETLRGHCEIRPDAPTEKDAESVGDAKGWLTRQMRRGRSYKERIDQFPLTRHLDRDLVAKRCRSFQRLLHGLTFLVQAAREGTASVDPDPEALRTRLQRRATGRR
jgi:hypothetical protein